MLKPGVGVDSFVYHAHFKHFRGLFSFQKLGQLLTVDIFPDRQQHVLSFSDFFVISRIFLFVEFMYFGIIKDSWVDLTWRGGHILLNHKGLTALEAAGALWMDHGRGGSVCVTEETDKT
jgi:hypothetical protein